MKFIQSFITLCYVSMLFYFSGLLGWFNNHLKTFPGDGLFFNCFLGLSHVNACTYNPVQPITYFTLGDALAAIGLIIAVYQLRNPAWEITYAIRAKWQRQIFSILSALALTSIALAAITPQLQYNLPVPLSFPLFFELLGFLFFISAPLWLFVFSSKTRGLFIGSRARNFYYILFDRIAGSKVEVLDSCVKIISDNLQELTAAVKRFNTLPQKQLNVDLLNNREQETVYAYWVFNTILNEQTVVDYLVTKRLDFIIRLLVWFQKNALTEKEVGPCFNKLLARLFENPNSYLFSQLGEDGLANHANLYKIIFQNKYFLVNFKVFENSNLTADEISKKHFEVFFRSLEKTIETYFRNIDSLSIDSKYIIGGLGRLEGYLKSLDYKSYTGTDFKFVKDRLFEISSFLSSGVKFSIYKGLKNKDEEEYNKIKLPSNLAKTYAEVIYNYLLTLSTIKGDESFDYRTFSIFAIENVLGAGRSEIYKEAQAILLNLIWGKVKENVEQGHFPPLLKVYLSFMSYPHSKEEYNKLLIYLEKELSPKLLKSEKMANRKDLMEEILLPNNVVFNHATQKFEHISSLGDHQILEIVK